MDEVSGVYDLMLTAQADLSFHLEQPVFRNSIWHSADHILDIGSGNSYYSHLLSNRFPEKRFTCVEVDADLAASGEQRFENGRIRVVTGEFQDLPDNFEFDLLLMRMVCCHLEDRSSLYSWVNSRPHQIKGAIVIDADDENYLCTPSLPRFSEVLGSLRKYAVERTLRTKIDGEWRSIGFEKTWTHRIVVNSDQPFLKEKMYLYMQLSAMMVAGSPLPEDIARELFSWVTDPNSYVQYGMFASVFKTSKLN